MPNTQINVNCQGGDNNNGDVDKKAGTVTFGTSGNCKFTSFNFTPPPGNTDNPYCPPGFSAKTPPNGAGDTVQYTYDGSGIPTAGYGYTYSTDAQIAMDNGSGTIKNS